jgi:hypothetical protein
MNTGPAPAATYQLVLRGELGDQFGFLFTEMRLSREDGTTVLTGPLADQAQLAAILDQIQDLGLELLSAGRLVEADDDHTERT